jgi:hypothetical protein
MDYVIMNGDLLKIKESPLEHVFSTVQRGFLLEQQWRQILFLIR